MDITTCLLGSFYIMRSIFRFSNYFTNYLFNNEIIILTKNYYTEKKYLFGLTFILIAIFRQVQLPLSSLK